jgi:hypothetical protein
MTALSLVFLVVCIFGTFAYGSATWMAVRESTPVWGRHRQGQAGVPPDGVSLTMFVACTTWFALNALAEARLLMVSRPGSPPGSGWIDLGVFVCAFVFPPLIMHVVYRETGTGCAPPRGPWWHRALVAMYVISAIAGVYLVGAALGAFPRPTALGRVIALTFTVLFSITSVYATLIMLWRRRASAGVPRPQGQLQMGNAMLSLFFLLTMLFSMAAILGDRSGLVVIADRLSRTAPLMFLAVAMYFENRFDFYDLVIKRGLLLVWTVLVLGVVFAVAQPIFDAMPAGAVRPWLMAIVLVPAAMTLPWLARELSRALDRLWFGRAFTPVDAVKHVLAAMQAATNEVTLVRDTEQRLADIFRTPVTLLTDDAPLREGPVLEVQASTPSGARVRFAVSNAQGARRLLSEDLHMLRSLASVFGFMLETVRLQHKRQEQELVAQELRLQTSRSELKALRAQINPHFLFNALNAIASLIHTDPARADEAVAQLAEVFRYTLRRADSEWAPLDQELAFARAYLDVEQARFGQRLTVAIDADDAAPPPLVPSMLLQTLVENAVKHGVSQTRGPGRIEVIVRTTASDITVDVRDNGPGPDGSPTMPGEGTGFGLRSVRERLAGHFGERAHLSLTRDLTGTMTIARIVMPIVRVAV